MNTNSARRNEFEFADRDFAKVRALLKQRSGIDVGAAKRMLVYGRLVRRLRALGLPTFTEYLRLVDDPASAESVHFLNALTTNVTELFREDHHFQLLTTECLRAANSGGERRLRIWSAGCSSGDEPYSIAITLASLPELANWDIKVLATDIDSEVLERAKRATYPSEKIEALPPARRRWFERGVGKQQGLARVRREARELVTFNRLNLLEPWPMRGSFDVIFCRNVVIYFDAPTRDKLVRRFAALLAPGGCLFLGHSEAPAAAAAPELRSCGRTAFRKVLESKVEE